MLDPIRVAPREPRRASEVIPSTNGSGFPVKPEGYQDAIYPEPPGSVQFDTPGETTFTFPVGYDRVFVELWGGGGGGGAAFGNAGAGGGGGAYVNGVVF